MAAAAVQSDIKTVPVRRAEESKRLVLKKQTTRTTTPTFGDVRHISRGGGEGSKSIRDVLVDVRKTILDKTIFPWAKENRKLVFHGFLVSLVIAQLTCYYGLIGEKGEGLYEFVLDNEDVIRARISALGLQPGGLLRTTIEGFINSFLALPDRAKFAFSVSLGVSFFPFFVRCCIYLSKVILIGYANFELLALVGILGGNPGKGAVAWYNSEGGRQLFKSVGRTAERYRLQLRRVLFRRYQMGPLIHKYMNTAQEDKVLWVGSAIGSVASVLLGGEQV
jgi:hypothetical protein